MFDKLAEEYQDQSMTLPDERFRAVFDTADFLVDLTVPSKTPGVPRTVRDRARALLRHYPTYYDLKHIESAAPEIMRERYEELHKFILRGVAARGEDDHGR